LFSNWQRELNRVPIGFTTLYIQLLCGYAPYFPWSLCYLSTVTVTCDSNVMWLFCDCCHTFFLWLCDLSHDIFPCSTLVIKEKKRKGKEILNNDLAILPSHDRLIVWELDLRLNNIFCHYLNFASKPFWALASIITNQ